MKTLTVEQLKEALKNKDLYVKLGGPYSKFDKEIFFELIVAHAGHTQFDIMVEGAFKDCVHVQKSY